VCTLPHGVSTGMDLVTRKQDIQAGAADWVSGLFLSLVSCAEMPGSQELPVQALAGPVSLGHTRLDQVGCVSVPVLGPVILPASDGSASAFWFARQLFDLPLRSLCGQTARQDTWMAQYSAPSMHSILGKGSRRPLTAGHPSRQAPIPRWPAACARQGRTGLDQVGSP
jgi:hypothetical protein